VREAAERIRPLARRTPVFTSSGFDTEAGVRVFFKCEKLPARRSVQDSRRLEPDSVAAQGRAGARIVTYSSETMRRQWPSRPARRGRGPPS